MMVPAEHPRICAASLGQARPVLQTSASAAASAAPATGPAAPFVLAAAGIMYGLSYLFGRARPRQKEEASRLADEVERKLQENLAAYQAGPRTTTAQQAHLAVFDYAWNQFVAAVAPLGDPGRRAIEERARGGTVPGTSGNWFVWYRDPIEKDPQIQAEPGLVASLFPAGFPWEAAIGAAVLIIGVLVL